MQNQELSVVRANRLVISNIDGVDIPKMPRNFKGLGPRPGVNGHRFDKEGQPYFVLNLRPDIGEQLMSQGWEVYRGYPGLKDENGEFVLDKSGKHIPDENAEPFYSIKLLFDTYTGGDYAHPTEVTEISQPNASGRRTATPIDIVRDSVVLGDLDDIDFEKAEVKFHGWEHKSGKNTGLKAAYLDSFTYSLVPPVVSDMWGDVDFGGLDGEVAPFGE